MTQMQSHQSQTEESRQHNQRTRLQMHPKWWTAAMGAIVLGLLFAALPERLTYVPSWLPLLLIVILFMPFAISALLRKSLPHVTARILGFLLLGVVTLALAGSVFLLVYTLPTRTAGQSLLRDAVLLWFINIFVFALWYWEIDGGGPVKRHNTGHPAIDLMFPQQQTGQMENWAPHFIDYLFVAFTGATALSPTDTFPLTRKAKGLMMVEALIGVTIIVMISGRAINIL